MKPCPICGAALMSEERKEIPAWAVLSRDGQIIDGSICEDRKDAMDLLDYEGERVVRVAYRIVDEPS